ncbi:uncharacterized protein LOC110843166 [Folsomia candida]|nr:uncharacterized protein LOC110843166 [Folsomia candida]
MHSTNVLLNEPEFMDKVYDKLIEEESKGLKNTTVEREQAEKDRVKSLVIEGKMVPPADMAYLKNHPVFKVNTMLKRLDQHDKGFLAPTIQGKISPVEPYEFDGDKFFKHLHKKGGYWIPSEELIAEEEKLEGKIARAKLRLREKRAKEVGHEKMMRVLYENDNEEINRYEMTRGSDASVTSYQSRAENISQMLSSLSNERERQAASFRRRRAQLEREEAKRQEQALFRQTARDRVYLMAKELERQAYVARHYQRHINKQIPPDAGLSMLFSKPKHKFENLFSAPPTPPDVEETNSFQNMRRYFGVRGTDFERFQSFNNPLIERYLDVVTKVDDILEGAAAVTDMYSREEHHAKDLLKKIKHGIN